MGKTESDSIRLAADRGKSCGVEPKKLSLLMFGQLHMITGPVKLMQRVEIAYSFLVCVILFHYHFKLAYVVLHWAVKEFFETHF